MRKVKDERIVKIKGIFNRLKDKLESEYSATGVTVYMIDTDKNIMCITGDKIENMVIERYLSYCNTMLLRSPVGLQEDKVFKSRIVTQLKINGDVYLIIISSYKLEAFKQDMPVIIEYILDVKKEGELL